MNAHLPLFLGFLGALLAAAGLWRSQAGSPVGMAVALVGMVLLFVVAFIYLLALLGAIVIA